MRPGRRRSNVPRHNYGRPGYEHEVFANTRFTRTSAIGSRGKYLYFKCFLYALEPATLRWLGVNTPKKCRVAGRPKRGTH